MAKIEITKAELVWPGKYNGDGALKEPLRVRLPFQVIETINESRASRQVAKVESLSLFDVWEGKEGDTFEAGWTNKLIWGDNLLVMGSLLERFAGKVDLIYIDPPFATGADFSFTTQVGDGELKVNKEQSVIEEKAYRDTWGGGMSTFLTMMYDRLSLLRLLLVPHGSLFVHLDATTSHLVRTLLDELFGRESFCNHVVWSYKRWPSTSNIYQRMHDDLLFFRKAPRDPNIRFTVQYEKVSESYQRRFKGKTQVLDPETGTRKITIDEPTKGLPQRDVWDISIIAGVGNERLGFPTQKPEALLRRIVETTSRPGDLVADFFCGSGTALAVSEKLGRRWIGCDLSRWAIHVSRKRLLDIEGCRPFEVLNLGKYERQYWQVATFGPKNKGVIEKALYEYLAFMLKLYGAQPLAGLMNLHGKKGKAMVHIGAVDAPVTIDEINDALDESVQLKQAELHVLGWEWEMGLAGPNNDYRKGGPMHEVAKQKGVKLLLFQIPREVMEPEAVEKGDIRFFELAYLEVEVKPLKKLAVQVRLKDFVIPNTELIPDEVRNRVKKWSDYIDYWAVDWDFQNDTFMQGWVTYRTRKDRALAFSSDTHAYPKAGKYRILVKVIDIFGNDTSQAFAVEVK
jgi:adenine-specific DNA-methyltransferase